MRARTGRALVAALLVTAGATAAAQARSAPAPTPAVAAAVAQDPARAGTWYCPVTGAEEDQTVLSVAAAGDEATQVAITRYGRSGPVSGEAVTIQPGGVHETALPPGDASPLAVRWSGGPATAAMRLQGPDGVASLACAPGPRQQWLLAGLDTASGSESLLHLHNPYAGDAVVHVSFATADGRVERLLGDAVLVPARSALQLDIGELEPERLDLGVLVSVRAGRVIAAGEVRMEPPEGLSGPKGRTLLAAVPEPAQWWGFADARQGDRADSWLSLLNPGEVDAAVEVRVSDPLPGGGTLDDEVTVPAGAVLRVPLAETSSAPEFGVQVQSVNGVGVAAALVTDLRGEAGQEVSATSGAAAGATHWSLVGAGTAVPDAVAVVHNPGSETATVSVHAPGAPPAWRGVQLAANSRVALPGSAIPDGQAPPALALEVTADRPVLAEVRTTTTEPLHAWTVGAVPARAWTGPPQRPAVVLDPELARRSTGMPEVQP